MIPHEPSYPLFGLRLVSPSLSCWEQPSCCPGEGCQSAVQPRAQVWGLGLGLCTPTCSFCISETHDPDLSQGPLLLKASHPLPLESSYSFPLCSSPGLSWHLPSAKCSCLGPCEPSLPLPHASVERPIMFCFFIPPWACGGCD